MQCHFLRRTATVVLFVLALVPILLEARTDDDYPQGEAIVIGTLPKAVEDLRERLQLPNPELLSPAQQLDREQWIKFAHGFIARAMKVLDDDILPNDPQFRLYFYYVLGASYMYLGDWHQAEVFLETSLSHIPNVGSEMPGIVASLRLTYINLCFETGHLAKAFSHVKALIEEGQGLGSGEMANFVAAREVREHYRLVARAHGLDDAHIMHYLKSLSDRYNNEVGCAADAQLLELALERKDTRESERLKERLTTRYPKSRPFTSLYGDLLSNR